MGGVNDVMHGNDTVHGNYTVHETDVVIVGAGMAGISAAYRLQEGAPDADYVILEARSALGGTWDLFRYPGVRSDSDAFTLALPFEPWRGADSIVAGEEVREYLTATARTYGIDRKVRYDSRVETMAWDSDTARWTVTTATGEIYRARFVAACAGYYSYDDPHDPDFDGLDTFDGDVLHPQFWPEGYDWSGKNVVVIGSGATAVSLVPAMAEQAAHVTMLQRTPGYLISQPRTDRLANTARRLLGNRAGARFAIAKNTALQHTLQVVARHFPRLVGSGLRAGVAFGVGSRKFTDRHFTPPYAPWEQRLCAMPDGDLLRAVRARDASVVTGRTARFVPQGVELEDGRVVEADVVVTATGLRIKVFGGATITVDGELVDPGTRYALRGSMLDGVPNLSFSLGFFNFAWAARVDLVAQFMARVVARLLGEENAAATPTIDGAPEWHPLFDQESGYFQRARDLLPRSTDTYPWAFKHDVRVEQREFRRARLDDGLVWSSAQSAAGRPGAGSASGSRTTGSRADAVDTHTTESGIRYVVAGQGEPLVLLHGIGRSHEDWAEVLPELARSYRVHAVDLPGFGGSRRLPERSTLPGLADALATFLDEVRIEEPVHLMGNSLGGATAMQLATLRPDAVASLTLVDSAGFGRDCWVILRLLTQPVTHPFILNKGRFSAAVTVRSIVADRTAWTRERVDATQLLTRSPDYRPVFGELIDYLGQWGGIRTQWRADLLDGMRRLDVPVLVLWGDRDMVLPHRHFANARDAFPEAETHVFIGAGHMPQIERPGEFLRVTRRFLAGAGAREAARTGR